MQRLTRRRFGALAAAGAALAPALGRAEAPVPLVIAEGGAAAERPEDARSAYDQAINEGCDYIQANLVPTKDGVLIARRDNELSATTDVAAHAEFAARKTTKTIGGASIAGWFSEDFTLAELQTLFCRERLPALRPQAARYDGKEPILSLSDVLAIARAGCVRTGRTIGVMPRLLHVDYFAGLDLAVDQILADDLNTGGYNSTASAIWVQAVDPDVLKSLSRLTRVKRMQLIDPPAAGSPPPAMLTPAGLADVRSYAQAIGPDQSLVIDPAGAVFPSPTTLVADAHAAGLSVHSRTAQGENAFLPKLLQRGDPTWSDFASHRGDVDKLMVSLFAGGCDGVATSLPDRAVRDRNQAIQMLQRAQGGQR